MQWSQTQTPPAVMFWQEFQGSVLQRSHEQTPPGAATCPISLSS